MKHFNKLFVAVAMVMGLSSQAQDSNNPWAISFGTNAVDTRVSAASKVEDQFSQYFNVNDNWNILPSVSYITVSRHINKGFTFGVTGSVNRIKNWVEPRTTIPGDYTVINPGDLSYYAVDGKIQYSLGNLFGWKVVDPSAHVGGGYASMGKASYGTANAGLGLTFWLSEMFGVEFQSTYKYSFDQDSRIPEQNVPSHMQHFAGLIFKFGGKDTDGDGIYDKDDACPKVFGVAENKGCPKLDKKEVETVKFAFQNLEFETGKDVIRTKSYVSLNGLAKLLVDKPSYGLKIEGHTDNVGDDAKNLDLSNRRAAAVKAYLVKKGVDASKLDTAGYGETHAAEHR